MRFLLLVTFYLCLASITTIAAMKYDVVIYGGTSAGISAAIQSSRAGKSVVVIEPSNRIGGLTTGGLGATDIGSKSSIGGISLEFYKNIKKYYDQPSSWKFQKASDYSESRTQPGEAAMWTFEPSVALKVYHDMLSVEKVVVVYNQRLNREKGVHMKKGKIASIKMESGKTFRGKVFIDATYEGDLMASAGVSYSVGREANTQYGETLNGVQNNESSPMMNGRLSHNAKFHNFIEGVDPYVIKGKPSSGLLPYINASGPGAPGYGDDKIQAYCFRMTLTDYPENRIPFQKPADYNELNFELLFRNYEAAKGPITKMYSYGDPLVPWINTPMPNRKTDTNNQKGFSTDFIGQNYNYPEGTYAEREQIINEHLTYQQGLMWTLAYHPRIPQKVRDVVSKWGTCKDEYDKTTGWQHQLYIREARRMRSAYVMTQKNCEGIEVASDPICMAGYGMDSHHVQRYVDSNGFVQNEGNVEAGGLKPYPVSYRSIIPNKDECTNLIVPVCISATHIAFGSLRMEPVFMILGQSAAVAAVIAIDQKQAVQDVPYEELRKRLIIANQLLDW